MHDDHDLAEAVTGALAEAERRIAHIEESRSFSVTSRMFR